MKVIKSIHGENGLIGHFSLRNIRNSNQVSIINTFHSLHSKGVDLMSYCKRVIGDGKLIGF